MFNQKLFVILFVLFFVVILISGCAVQDQSGEQPPAPPNEEVSNGHSENFNENPEEELPPLPPEE